MDLRSNLSCKPKLNFNMLRLTSFKGKNSRTTDVLTIQ